MTTKVDAFISGAGPVGLYFAYQMAQRGHSVYICDFKSGPTLQSRALVISSRTLEILDTKGLSSEILYNAFVPSGFRIFIQGKQVGATGACGDTIFPHMSVVAQGKTEQVFYDRLEKDTGCKVHWETELVSYVQEESHVIVTVKNKTTQQEEIIESKYIIGSDGVHSKVRKSASDWLYEGKTIDTKFILADLKVEGDNIPNMKDKANMFLRGSRFMGIIRIIPPEDTKDNSQIFRIFGNVDSFKVQDSANRKVTHGVAKNQEGPDLVTLQEWLDHNAFPLKFKLSDLIWSSYFKINERIANGFRRNRAFVIGDAAHCHSPVGGQGMNLGLQDADNLAWKLSTVLKGQAKDPEILLDSYNDERFPLAKKTIGNTGTSTRIGIFDNPIINAIRKYFLKIVLKINPIKEYIFKATMQQLVTLDPNTSNILGKSDKGLIQAGKFLPDTDPLRKSFIAQKPSQAGRIEKWTLRSLIRKPHSITVVLVATCQSNALPNLNLIQHFWEKTKAYGDVIQPLIIQSAWHTHFQQEYPDYLKNDKVLAEATFFSEESFESSHSVTRRVGLYSILTSYFAPSKPGSVVLIIRPDLYVAQAKLVTTETEIDQSLELLSSIVTA